ncbi:hypothetical protein BaRGS_00014319 [Batillaria attramentaria]|uniref:Uncharacterized protein n=1 Tax=Batillaria attramentaria TaxID=370345 RepID=A0ABD0L5S2_9CAEN
MLGSPPKVRKPKEKTEAWRTRAEKLHHFGQKTHDSTHFQSAISTQFSPSCSRRRYLGNWMRGCKVCNCRPISSFFIRCLRYCTTLSQIDGKEAPCHAGEFSTGKTNEVIFAQRLQNVASVILYGR